MVPKLMIVACALILASCTPSLYPLYTDADVLFDPALLGVWRQSEDKDFLVALRDGKGGYRILYTDNGGGSGVFTGRLVQLGELRFVDLYPGELKSPNGFYGGHFVRTHTVSRIELKGNRLILRVLDPDWFEKEGAKTSPVRPVKLGEDLLLMAPTAQLRDFVAKFADTKAFSSASTWIREP